MWILTLEATKVAMNGKNLDSTKGTKMEALEMPYFAKLHETLKMSRHVIMFTQKLYDTQTHSLNNLTGEYLFMRVE